MSHSSIRSNSSFDVHSWLYQDSKDRATKIFEV